MKIKLAVLTIACALFSIGSVTAAEQPEPNQPANTAAEQTAPNPVSGFSSGTGMGPGGSAGSASSLAGGFGSAFSGSGFIGSSPLSMPDTGGTGGTGGGAIGPR